MAYQESYSPPWMNGQDMQFYPPYDQCGGYGHNSYECPSYSCPPSQMGYEMSPSHDYYDQEFYDPSYEYDSCYDYPCDQNQNFQFQNKYQFFESSPSYVFDEPSSSPSNILKEIKEVFIDMDVRLHRILDIMKSRESSETPKWNQSVYDRPDLCDFDNAPIDTSILSYDQFCAQIDANEVCDDEVDEPLICENIDNGQMLSDDVSLRDWEEENPNDLLEDNHFERSDELIFVDENPNWSIFEDIGEFVGFQEENENESNVTLPTLYISPPFTSDIIKIPEPFDNPLFEDVSVFDMIDNPLFDGVENDNLEEDYVLDGGVEIFEASLSIDRIIDFSMVNMFENPIFEDIEDVKLIENPLFECMNEDNIDGEAMIDNLEMDKNHCVLYVEEFTKSFIIDPPLVEVHTLNDPRTNDKSPTLGFEYVKIFDIDDEIHDEYFLCFIFMRVKKGRIEKNLRDIDHRESSLGYRLWDPGGT